MTFRLYVMRHGDALMRASRDSLRPLSQLGHDQAIDTAKHLHSHLCPTPDNGAGNAIGLVLASPYLRAQETTRHVVEGVGYTSDVVTCDKITPNDAPDSVIKLLSDYESYGSVLMVSHQPLASALIGRLVSGHYHEGPPMGTASIVCLDMPTAGIGMAELKWIKHSEI
ncbi:phosphohistidine phosphatase SixA [Gammaproteobacteria bacterium 42_54_T18]|nr:phosphohistidine phosphatase SixA [Gammaproteobacteria bacterium 42_54_T18]